MFAKNILDLGEKLNYVWPDPKFTVAIQKYNSTYTLLNSTEEGVELTGLHVDTDTEFKSSEHHAWHHSAVLCTSEQFNELFQDIAMYGNNAKEIYINDTLVEPSVVKAIVKAYEPEPVKETSLVPETDQEHMLVQALLCKIRNIPVEIYANKEWHRSHESNRMYLDFIYRVKKETPVIPWDSIKPEFKYAAMDKSGAIYAYQSKPKLGRVAWSLHGESTKINVLAGIDFKGLSWEESLVERPE